MYLLDTNILLRYPSVLNSYDGIVLSVRVLEELDHLKKSSNPEVGYEARRASHKIMLKMQKNHVEFCLDRKDKLSVDDDLIRIAKKHRYVLISNDLNVNIKAKGMGVRCETYDKVETDYTGVKYFHPVFDDNLYSEELENILEHGTAPFEMHENEFLIVKNEFTGESIANLIYENGKLRLLNGHSIKNDFIRKITPRNLEQDCLMEILKKRDISIVAATGKYGTGKSFLLTNFALSELYGGKIDKIVYVPNNSIVQDSRELGTLPGDTIDKELIYMGPILDIVGEDRARELVCRGQIEVVPISVMRGRSFEHSIIIVNEAQNLTSEHVKLLIARCGQDSRIFFDGDIKQSDSFVFKNKSGLKLLLHLAESEDFAPLFGTVKLNSIERSKTAQASEYLEELLI